MIIKCSADIPAHDYQLIISHIEKIGFSPDILRPRNGSDIPVIGIKGDCSSISPEDFARFSGVIDVQRITVPYKHASRNYQPVDTVITAGNVKIGGKNPPVFIAGPCAVESREQILKIAQLVKTHGGKILRGGAWKPRTYARSFEGLKEKALEYLDEARKLTGMPVLTEIVSPYLIEVVGKYTDIFQVGARNMQNYDLLDQLGKQKKPVLLKRGVSAGIDELLGAADRILDGGNPSVMLCLRGVRTFDYSQRYPADLYAIPDLLAKTHLPVIFDPSHAAGKRSLVPALTKMALAGGVHGVMIETHFAPCEALCDGAQMITPDELEMLVHYSQALLQIQDM